jgi:hypothetical protein
MRTSQLSAIAMAVIGIAFSTTLITSAQAADDDLVCFEVKGKDSNGDPNVDCEEKGAVIAVCNTIEWENEVCDDVKDGDGFGKTFPGRNLKFKAKHKKPNAKRRKASSLR